MEVCRHPNAEGRAHEPSFAIPCTTPHHAHGALAGGILPRGAALGRSALVVFVHAVLHPLPHIPRGVMEPPRIREQRTDRRRPLVTPWVAALAAVCLPACGNLNLIAPPILRRGASA